VRIHDSSAADGGFVNQGRDIFISYAEDGLEWARWIGWQLEEMTFSVILREWERLPGGNFVLDADEGTKNTSYTVVVASPSYFSSPCRATWTAAWPDHPIIPVVVENIQDPGLLGPTAPIVLAGLDEETARALLLTRMADVLRGPVKPTDPVRYPSVRLADGRPRIPVGRRAVPVEPKIPRSPAQTFSRRPVRNYLGWSIVLTMLNVTSKGPLMLAGIPIGVLAIFYGSRVNGRRIDGDLDGALRASRAARRWCLAALAVNLAEIAWVVFLYWVIYSGSDSGYNLLLRIGGLFSLPDPSR
jgi:hypothetical protein